MKCGRCGKEFPGSVIESTKGYDRGDGVMHYSTSYTYNPICPHCGFNNTPVVRM